MVNMAAERLAVSTDVGRLGWAGDGAFDLIQREPVRVAEGRLLVELGPYQVRWIRSGGGNGGSQ